MRCRRIHQQPVNFYNSMQTIVWFKLCFAFNRLTNPDKRKTKTLLCDATATAVSVSSFLTKKEREMNGRQHSCRPFFLFCCHCCHSIVLVCCITHFSYPIRAIAMVLCNHCATDAVLQISRYAATTETSCKHDSLKWVASFYGSSSLCVCVFFTLEYHTRAHQSSDKIKFTLRNFFLASMKLCFLFSFVGWAQSSQFTCEIEFGLA